METKEFSFRGVKLNGILMLFITIVMIFVSVSLIINGIASRTAVDAVILSVTGIALLIADLIAFGGFVKLEPGEARVMMFLFLLYTSLPRLIRPALTISSTYE